MFLILGICAFILSLIQIASFNIVGEAITKKIRIETFYKILKMPVPWFDIPRNNAGTLTARLSTDCQLVNTMTTTTASILIQNISTLVAGVIIAFVNEWRTSLVSLGLLPLMIICGIVQMAFSTGFSDKTDVAYKDSANLIMEAMVNIRTVSSFGY
jgi:ATP-binding cassette subfamily B (MDR/TAP) protein 1